MILTNKGKIVNIVCPANGENDCNIQGTSHQQKPNVKKPKVALTYWLKFKGRGEENPCSKQDNLRMLRK